MTEDEMIVKAKFAYKMGKLRNQKLRLDARRNHMVKTSKKRKSPIPQAFMTAEELVKKYPDQFKAMPGATDVKALFIGESADDIVSLYIEAEHPELPASKKVTLWVSYANHIIESLDGNRRDGPHRRYKKKRWLTTR